MQVHRLNETEGIKIRIWDKLEILFIEQPHNISLNSRSSFTPSKTGVTKNLYEHLVYSVHWTLKRSGQFGYNG